MDVQDIIQEQVNTHPGAGDEGHPAGADAAWPPRRENSVARKTAALLHGVNVLEDSAIREGVKVFSDWPTIPQLYIRGEFIGGCDIMREMFQSGEPKQLSKVSPRAGPSSKSRRRTSRLRAA